MPDQKISQLTDGGSAQSTDQIPINRGGVNYRLNASTLGGPGSSSSGQVLYNSSGAIAGDAGLTYDAATDTLSLGSTGRYAISTDLFLNRDAANVFSLRNGTTAQGFRLYQTTDASTTNYTRGGLGYNTFGIGKYLTLYSQGAGTESANIPILIQPGGSGALLLGPPPDGASTGGNQRGAYAVDLQMTRSSADQVASGSWSFVAGLNNRASNTGSVTIGNQNVASASNAVAIGQQNNASNTAFFIGYANSGNQQYAHGLGANNSVNGSRSSAIGYLNSITNQECVALGTSNTLSSAFSKALGHSNSVSKEYSIAIGLQASPAVDSAISFAGGAFSSAGDSQYTLAFARATTTNNTQTTLQFGGYSLVIPTSRTWFGEVYMVATSTNAASNAGFVRRFMVKRDNAANTSLVGSVQTIGTDIGSNAGAPPAGWAVDITANDTNENVEIKVTGATSTTIRWHCTLKLYEVVNP